MRRSEILAAARALLLEEGYQATSMRRIANRLRITPTSLYLYFRNKEELFDRLMQETFAILLDRLKREQTIPGPALDRLRRGMEAYIRFGLAHPDHYRFAFMLLAGNANSDKACNVDNRAPSLGEQCFAMLRDSVTVCIEAGMVRPGDVSAIAEMLWGMMHGITAMLIKYKDHLETPEDAIIDRFLSTALAGLTSDA